MRHDSNMPRLKKRSSKQNHLASLDGLWMFSGGWHTLRPLTGIFASAFGLFSLASWCYIHFPGFAGQSLDVFRGMTDIMSTDRHFRSGFWTFLASFLVLHPVSWLRGRDLGVFRELTDITSSGWHFRYGFWTFLANLYYCVTKNIAVRCPLSF